MQQVVQKESHEAVQTIYLEEKANIPMIHYVFKWMKKNSFASTSSGPGSKPLLGATIAPNLVPWVLNKIFPLEMVKNDICLGGVRKQNAFFSKNVPQKTYPCPCLE